VTFRRHKTESRHARPTRRYWFDAHDKIDIRLIQDETARRVGLVSGRRGAVDPREKNDPPEPIDIPVALNSNAVAGIFRSPVTLSLHPKRHALARSKNVVITSESAFRRTKEGSAFGRNSVLPILGEICLFGCPTPSEGWVALLCGSRLREIRSCGSGDDCLQNARAKQLRMNTYTKTGGGRGSS
jgi:hypothetical protein